LKAVADVQSPAPRIGMDPGKDSDNSRPRGDAPRGEGRTEGRSMFAQADAALVESFVRKQCKNERIATDPLLKILQQGAALGIGDRDLLSSLRKLVPRKEPVAPPEEARRGEKKKFHRGRSRVRDIEPWLRKVRGAADGAPLRYLDVGCAEASITGAVAAELGLDEDAVYACDVLAPEQLAHKLEVGVQYRQSSQTHLPYGDAEFDLATVFMSAHHFEDAPRFFEEIRRVLKPGAHLILREHDSSVPGFAAYLDVIHALYSTVFGDEMTVDEFVAGYRAAYRTDAEWRGLVAGAGFDFLGKLLPVVGKERGGGKKGGAGGGRGVDRFRSFYMHFIAA